MPVNRRLKLILMLILTTVGIILAARYAIEYLSPFLLALVFAAIIDPFVNIMEKRLHISRGIAVCWYCFYLWLCLGYCCSS